MSVKKSIQYWLAAGALALLAACGGGGGSSGESLFGDGGSNGGSGSAAAVGNVQVVFTPRQVSSSGTETVKAAVTVTDASGRGLPNVPVAIGVDNDATFSTTTDTTNASGVLEATVTIGANYDARTINFSAKAGSVTRTVPLQVINGSGNQPTASGLIVVLSAPTLNNTPSSTVTATVTAVNGNRNALAGIPVDLSIEPDTDTAVITRTSLVTDSTGRLTAQINIGSDRTNRELTLVASSGTQLVRQKFRVVGAKLTAQVSKSVLLPGEDYRIEYSLKDNAGNAMPGLPYQVVDELTNAVLASGPETGVDGAFTVRLLAGATPGTQKIKATAGGAEIVSELKIESTGSVPPATLVVTSASVAANPSVVPVNAGGSIGNSVQLRALFRAANNTPVENVRVWFDLDGNRNSVGGTLSNFESTTPFKPFKPLFSDKSGVATATYTPGAISSPKDGLTVRICWSNSDFVIPTETPPPTIEVPNPNPVPLPRFDCPNEVRTTLTVTSESLSVSIGTNGTIEQASNSTTYVKRYVVQVVDAAGNARPGVSIAPSVDLVGYYKGLYQPGVVQGGGTSTPRWVQVGLGNTYPSAYPDNTSVPLREWNAVSGAFDGAPVPTRANTEVFDRGVHVYSDASVTFCENEDLNRNGVSADFDDRISGKKVPEDQNGSLNLTPGRPALDPRKADVAIKTEGGNVTNADGIVILKLEYPQNLATWVEYNILVSASGVAGTEGRANFRGQLLALAAHINDLSSDPAFRLSPYGVRGSRTYYRKDEQGNAAWVCVDPN